MSLKTPKTLLQSAGPTVELLGEFAVPQNQLLPFLKTLSVKLGVDLDTAVQVELVKYKSWVVDQYGLWDWCCSWLDTCWSV